MKRLFISQPMRDKTNEEIETERNRVIETAREFVGEEIEVIDSFFKDAPHDAKPLWFLGKSLELLSKADVAFFVKGWENYRGCRIEQLAAAQYGIQMIVEEGD